MFFFIFGENLKQMKIKSSFFSLLLVAFVLFSCDKDKDIKNTLIEYNQAKETEGYHFGDEITLPKEVTENTESISISFGDEETQDLKIKAPLFRLGENNVTFYMTTKGGEKIQQEATMNVFAKNPEQNVTYQIVKEYPHDAQNFVQGFQLEGNTIYESDGQHGTSQLLKYTLGSTTPIAATKQSQEIFSEGATIVGNKVYQLTWMNKKGFIYDKSSLKLLSEFTYPNQIGEGWGLTYDGKNLIVSDGSNQLYFLNVENPSEVVKTLAVAGAKETYTKINELEFHDGFIYANIWQQPIIIKINPENGEVVARFDFSEIAKINTTSDDDVLNGIAFKGQNMLVTGKNWSKIYEVAVK